MNQRQIIASNLKFPEGPIWMADGSVILVEIARGTLTRVFNGVTEVIADLGGGPNGAAIAPDGQCYVCNNGGFIWHEKNGRLYPGEQPESYQGGSIQRVNLLSGNTETLFTECDGIPLKGPNDLVFDRSGGFWFTDHGKTQARTRDRTGLFYVTPGCSSIKEAFFPLDGPNGVGLSPDEQELYVAETGPGRVWAFPLSAPGQLQDDGRARRLLRDRGGWHMYDSLAVDCQGGICVASLIDGGIATLYPDGREPAFYPTQDNLTTNICFGGADLDRAFITLSSQGLLLETPWHVPGHPLNFGHQGSD